LEKFDRLKQSCLGGIILQTQGSKGYDFNCFLMQTNFFLDFWRCCQVQLIRWRQLYTGTKIDQIVDLSKTQIKHGFSYKVGIFFRDVLDNAERERLVDNMASHLCNAQAFIQVKIISLEHPVCWKGNNILILFYKYRSVLWRTMAKLIQTLEKCCKRDWIFTINTDLLKQNELRGNKWELKIK